ncbi:MAG: Dna2/Cas4 domain-containing protein [Methanomicrobiales archaeon]|nr:Dna2/Cas4 domain-containing protein [Methanomicrobiales archaeon]
MDFIGISQVVRAHQCPVRLYIEREKPAEESPRYTIAKQVSYHLGEALEEEAIWREIRAVQPGIGDEMRELLGGWIGACSAREWPKARQTDLNVSSQEYGIRGVVDKLFDGEPLFAVTRSSEAPAMGVYRSDRIRVAALSLCIAETLGIPAESGWVEYVPSGVLRPCTPSPRDRRMLLRAIEAARRVLSGSIPARPAGAPCDSCPHAGECSPAPRRLSDLF